MVVAKVSRFTRIARKAINVAPLVASSPQLLPLMRHGVHPEHFSRLNRRWLKDGNIQTVLDIGANSGQFARTIHALLPDATVYAFEPQENCFETLQRSLSGSPKLHAIRTAVGDEDGEITFHRNEYSQSSSVLPVTDLHRQTFPFAAESKVIRVPIQKLDTLQSELDLTPSILVKIDVQGYEDRVLRGGEQVLRQADYVLVETAFEQLYEGEAHFSTVYAQMLDYGFTYAGNLDQAMNPANGRPLYADALFLRNR